MAEFLYAHLAEGLTTIEPGDAAVRDILLLLMRSLAEYEDRVEVICIGMPEGAAFHVHCTPGDVGRLIGNQGRTARSIRAILKAIASKNGRRYTLIIAQ